ncbi:amino acid ABC transporter permease [Cohnella luojiensis]|uniref:Amino acid ABC transporter permease n=1 Tax=Cohnella luojiensis TaxID=652876 RepID=A0A4Y8LV31_9BACL|nr:amino acid ABC transporter permease [Cohnella luojiensis]TFE25576.1 amino acid ABC transporter permease [Cohnella luojiensis]
MDFKGAYTTANLKFLLEGFYVTLEVAFIAIAISFVIGCVTGTLRYAKVPVLSQALAFEVELIRNLPLLLIIFFTRFALPEVGINLGTLYSSIVALAVFEAAMISEVVRSGLNSVDKGQIEAARSSGLNGARTLWHIVLPQGLRRMVPPLVSQFISLLKDTSLAVGIALPELMHNANIVVGHNYNSAIPILMVVAVMYFVVNYILSLVSRRLENRMA